MEQPYVTTGEFARAIDMLREDLRTSRAEILTAVHEYAKTASAKDSEVASLAQRIVAIETAKSLGRDYYSRIMGFAALLLAAIGTLLSFIWHRG